MCVLSPLIFKQGASNLQARKPPQTYIPNLNLQRTFKMLYLCKKIEEANKKTSSDPRVKGCFIIINMQFIKHQSYSLKFMTLVTLGRV